MLTKTLAGWLLAATLFVSCSKGGSSDDDDDDNKTTVKFTNTLSYTLENAKVGSWKGDGNPAKLIRDLGNFAAGANSGEIPITDGSLIKVYFYCDISGKTYMSDHGFSISQGTFNNWNINGSTSLMEITKTSDLYPR